MVVISLSGSQCQYYRCLGLSSSLRTVEYIPTTLQDWLAVNLLRLEWNNGFSISYSQGTVLFLKDLRLLPLLTESSQQNLIILCEILCLQFLDNVYKSNIRVILLTVSFAWAIVPKTVMIIKYHQFTKEYVWRSMWCRTWMEYSWWILQILKWNFQGIWC